MGSFIGFAGARNRRSRGARRRGRHIQLEILECRLVLNATIVPTVSGSNVTLNWTGDTSADDVTLTYDPVSPEFTFSDPGHTIFVAADPHITIYNNDTSAVSIAPNGVTFEQINFTDGTTTGMVGGPPVDGNTYELQTNFSGTPVAVNGPASGTVTNDQVFIGTPSGQIGASFPAVSINYAAPSIVAVKVDDTSDSASQTFALSSSELDYGSPLATLVKFNSSPISTFEIDGGTGKNTFNVTSTPPNGTPAGCDTIIQAGNINDTVTLGGSTVAPLGAQGLSGTIEIKSAVSNSPALTVDDSQDTVGRSLSLSSTSLTGSIVNGATVDYSDLASLTVKGGSGNNTFSVSGTPANITTTLDAGGGADSVTLGGNTSSPLGAQGLNGTIKVLSSSGGKIDLVVDDSANTGLTSATLGATQLTGLAPATITYMNLNSLKVKGGSSGNTYTVTGTPAAITTTLDTGGGADTVNVVATGTTSTLNVLGQGGSEMVTLGGSLSSPLGAQGLNGTINVSNSAGGLTTALVVDDSEDPTHRMLSMSDTQLSGSLVNTATVNYANLTSLLIEGPTNVSGANHYTVTNTPSGTAGSPPTIVTTTINTGVASLLGSEVDVTATGLYSALNIRGQSTEGLIDKVVLGASAAAPLGAQGLNDAINISSANDTIALVVNDAADTIGQSITIDSADMTGTMVNGAIINYVHLKSLEVDGGSGMNMFTVNNTPNGADANHQITTTIDTGDGGDTTDVLAVSSNGPLRINDGLGLLQNNTVTLGNNGSVQAITGDVYVHCPPNTTTLTVDDSSDTVPRTATVNTGELDGLAPGTISWDALQALNINGGSGGNQWTIIGGAGNGVTGTTTLNAGTGGDSILVNSTTAGFTYNLNFQSGHDTLYFGNSTGMMSAIQGTFIITQTPGSGHTLGVTVDDSQAGAAETIGVNSTAITGLSYAGPNGSTPGAPFPLSIFGTVHLNTLTIVPPKVSGNAITVSGLGKASGPADEVLVMTSSPGSTSLTIDDSADPSGQAVKITPTQLMFTSGPIVDYSGASLAGLTYNASNAGGNNITVTGSPVNSSMTSTINVGMGSGNAVTFGDAGDPASGFTGDWFVEDGSGATTSLTVNDASDQGNAIVSLKDAMGVGSVAFAGGPTFSFVDSFLSRLTVDGGMGNNQFTVYNTPSGVPTAIHGNGGQDTVDIGAGRADLYNGEISVDNVPVGGSTNLVIDDSQKPGAQTISFDSNDFMDLTPASITYGTGVTDLTLAGGTGGNTWKINGTPSTVTTTIETGVVAVGGNTVYVGATSGPLNIDDQADDSITAGNYGMTGNPGSLSGIAGPMDLTVATGKVVQMTLDNSLDTGDYTATLAGTPAQTTLSGLPFMLQFPADQMTGLTLLAGLGDNTLNVDFTDGNTLPSAAAGTLAKPNLDFVGTDTPANGNTLDLYGGGAGFTNETYNATGPGSGSIALDASSLIAFSGLQPINDIVPAANYTFIPPSASQYVDLTNGPMYLGVQTATISSPATPPGFELVNYGNKTNVTIDASGGSGNYDFDLNNSTTAASQTTLSVTLGDADDTADIQATPGGVKTSISTGNGNDFVTVVGAGLATGPAPTSLAINGGTGVNTLRVDGNSPGMTTDLSQSGKVLFNSPAGASSFTYSYFSNLEDIQENHAPTFDTPIGISGPQGEPLTDVVVGSFSDADVFENAGSYSATIDWGDGSAETPGTVAALPGVAGQYVISGSHTYTGNGPYSINVSVTDSGGLFPTSVGSIPYSIQLNPIGPVTGVGATVTINSGQIAGQGANIFPVVGTPFSGLVATFQDLGAAGPPSSYTVNINWGDGNTTPATQVNAIGDTFTVTGTHTYSATGLFSVTTTIENALDGTAVVSGTAVVGTAPLSLVSTTPQTYTAGTLSASYNLGLIEDPYAAEAADPTQYVTQIDWGDGTPSTGGTLTTTGTATELNVVGGHNFAQPGTYSGSIEVDAPDGQVLNFPFSSTVVGLSVSGASNLTALAGQPTGPVTVATFTATPTPDPSGYTALVDWGDGTGKVIGTITPGAGNTFNVSTNGHTYAVAGTFTVAVTISDSQGFVVGSASPSMQVVVPITGQVSPQSINGTSQGVVVSRDTTPTFVGYASPGTTIEVFASPTGSGIPLGSLIALTTTAGNGFWSATVPANTPLANGGYVLTAAALNSHGIVVGSQSLGSMIIDTLGPQVDSLNFNRMNGTLYVGFTDSLGGLNLQSLADPAFYRLWAKALTTPRVRIPAAFVPTSISVTPSAGPTNTATVAVVFNYGRRMKNGTYTVEIPSTLSGGASLVDIAGNPLAGTYRGAFPSGNGVPSGAFVAMFTTTGTGIRFPAPTRNGYVPPYPVSGSLARIAVTEVPKSAAPGKPLAGSAKKLADEARIHDQAVELLAHETAVRRRRSAARNTASQGGK